MELLTSLLVGRPLVILAVAAAFLVGGLLVRVSSRSADRCGKALLLASCAWALYATWEWLVQARTPDANIRVDLLVIWPVVGLLSAWALLRTLR